MKPITDDIVLSLIERAERRRSALHPANEVQPVSGASGADAPASGRIISLDFVRPTHAGEGNRQRFLFLCAPDLKQPSYRRIEFTRSTIFPWENSS